MGATSGQCRHETGMHNHVIRDIMFKAFKIWTLHQDSAVITGVGFVPVAH